MHSSHPKSRGEKLLIDMDRIRKSLAGGAAGGRGGGYRRRENEKVGDRYGDITHRGTGR